jgi:hypothetical protein
MRLYGDIVQNDLHKLPPGDNYCNVSVTFFDTYQALKEGDSFIIQLLWASNSCHYLLENALLLVSNLFSVQTFIEVLQIRSKIDTTSRVASTITKTGFDERKGYIINCVAGVMLKMHINLGRCRCCCVLDVMIAIIFTA